MATESFDVPRQPARGPSNFATNAAGARESRQREPQRRALRAASSLLNESRTAQALGWLSVGLGLTALLAPRALGTATGIGARTGMLRMIGLRELAAGAGLLTARDARPWLWSRVAGDTLDLLVLGAAAARPATGERTRSLVSLGIVASITAADVAASVRQSRRSQVTRAGPADEYIERSVVINKSTQECYDFWRNLNNAPNFMRMIDSVTVRDERNSHWVARLPGRRAPLEWDSQISEDRPGERIAWHSAADAPLLHAGVVSFERAPGDRGTLVRLVVHYRPRAGRAGVLAARAAGQAPEIEITEDLRRFKQILETGEIPTTRHQPAGRRSLLGRVLRAGRDA
jgi:uncharacterized membrane protein